MKNFSAFLLGAGLMAMPAPAQDLIARIHFAGAGQISADTNSTAFTNEFCSAEAKALEAQTLDKLSRAPFAWAKAYMPPDAANKAERFRPLLGDLLRAEWIFEVRAATNGSPEYVFAARLAADRAQLWQENLADVAQSWTYLSAEKTSDGWRLKKHLPPNLIRFVRAGDWIVVSCAQNEFPLSDEFVRRIQAEKRPVPAAKNYWLSVDADWPRLARWFPVLGNFDFPKIDLQVIGRENNLHLDGRLTLAQPLPPLEKWRLPTNAIRAPFVSFTAVRGVAPWLERQSWERRFDVQPAADQLFIWALPLIPFQTFAARPVPDGKAALAQIDAKLSGVFNASAPGAFLSPITLEMTNNRISFTGLPFFSPFMQALHGPAGDFLFGGFFPNIPRAQPLPPELFTQLNQPDLVYYHWENSTERLKQLPQLTQLLLMVTMHRQFDTQSAAGKWLDRIGPALGYNVTEVSQTAPNELAFVRTSPSGLTAIELLALGSWLEAPDFPICNLKLPPRKPLNFKHPHPQIPGGPPAPAPAPLATH